MARNGKIVIDHDDGLASMATWYKAFALTPIWGFLVFMPLGVFIRTYLPDFEETGFFFLLFLAFVYFVRDMAKRRVTIDDKDISFGMTRIPLAGLQSVDVQSLETVKYMLRLPDSLKLRFSEGQTITLMLSRMSTKDLTLLIETISRRVSHCKIDPVVEEILRRRRPQAVLRLEDPERLIVNYNNRYLLEELPAVLRTTVYKWSRLVGPVGTLLLATPLWLTFNHQLYSVLRNYENGPGNQAFYEGLVKIIGQVVDALLRFLGATQNLDKVIGHSPYIAFFCIVAAIYLLMYVFSSMLGANRLTVDADEISLDRFFNLFSFTEASAKWKNIARVKLIQPAGTADPNRASVTFVDKEGVTVLTVKMSALENRDREKLALAVEKFAGEAQIESTLAEALTPSGDKSYTELWLQSLSDAPSRKNLEPLAAGHLLENSRYEIEKKLAVGGEGVAYLGRDLSGLALGKIEQVVLKETLIPPFVDKQVQQKALERFEREARLLKELKSEYVVGLRDYFIEDHRCYLVLDFVEGKNLKQYISERGRLRENEVLDLAGQMCAMLSFLHERGIIHRDFTPDNLILQADGRLKLIDFNVARDSDEGKTGTIVGKHAYVPPEQFRGKPTRQSDIYAMGATLYFLLTGEDPEPISQSKPGEKNAEISSGLEALVRDCTTLDTGKRLATVDEIREKIADITGAGVISMPRQKEEA